MMEFTSLTEALKSASLHELLNQALVQVKESPQDLKAREVLFKLYCVQGRWDKALSQLETLALLDEERHKQTELYKNLVLSEVQRSQVLTGKRQAATLQQEVPEWMTKLHQANIEHYQGHLSQAELTRSEAFELAPESAGKSKTAGSFSWIADSDGRLGPVCEFICAGGYRWLPFSSIQTLSVRAPKDLLDLIWLPATVSVADEIYHGYIPARYPIDKDEDQALLLGLKTEWQTLSDSLACGAGRKVLVTDVSDHSLMEMGDVEFE